MNVITCRRYAGIATYLLVLIAGTHLPAQDPPTDIPEFDTSELDIGLPEDFDEIAGGDFTDGDFGAAEISAEEQAAIAAVSFGMVVAIIVMSLIGLLLTIFVAYLLMDAVNSVPEQFQQIAPWVPWLLLVPFVNIVVLIVAFIKVPESLSAYLNSIGDTSQGDSGKAVGLWGSVLYVLGCTFPIGLVLLIISLVKINQSKKIARSAAA